MYDLQWDRIHRRAGLQRTIEEVPSSGGIEGIEVLNSLYSATRVEELLANHRQFRGRPTTRSPGRGASRGITLPFANDGVQRVRALVALRHGSVAGEGNQEGEANVHARAWHDQSNSGEQS